MENKIEVFISKDELIHTLLTQDSQRIQLLSFLPVKVDKKDILQTLIIRAGLVEQFLESSDYRWEVVRENLLGRRVNGKKELAYYNTVSDKVKVELFKAITTLKTAWEDIDRLTEVLYDRKAKELTQLLNEQEDEYVNSRG